MQALIDSAGKKLYIDVAGNGSPTVVFEAGAGCASDTWDPIWREVTAFTRAVRYDRANLGKSGQHAGPRTASDVVTDLHNLLTCASLSGPYVLVGHSFGGLFTRLFRDRYPEQVVGMILVDASHHEQGQRFLQTLPPEMTDEPTEIATWLRKYSNPQMQLGEGVLYWESQREVAAVAPVGSLPLTVLSRDLTPVEILAKQLPGFPQHLAVASESSWHRMQADLADLSSQSTYVVARGSGHYVHRDRPELVVEAIHRMVELTRSLETHRPTCK